MKLKLSFTVALLILVLFNLGYPQVLVTRNLMDYNFLGGGARAKAMGGAFLAVSDDPSAGTWNPAGLVQLDKYQMGATLNFLNPRFKYTTSYEFETLSPFANSLKQNKATFSFGSMIIPFTLYGKELVGSVAYNRVSDIYDKRVYNGLGVLEDTLVGHVRIGDKSEEIEGGLDVIVLSLGAKAYKDLSFGLGINIYTGSYEYNSTQKFDISWDVAYDTSVNYRPYIKGNYPLFSSVNFTLGSMYKYQNEKAGALRLGAVLRTPFTLTEEDDVQYAWDIIINDVVNPWGFPLGVIWPKEYKQRWEIPLMIGFGASYQVKGLTLAGDVEFRDFSSSELIFPSKWQTPNSPDSSIELNWNSITQFRLGAEYLLQSKYGTIPLRAGYRNDPKVFSDLKDVVMTYVDYDPPSGTDVIAIIDQSYGDKVSGSTFSFGTGIGWSQIKLDFTYEFSQYKTKMSGEVYGIPELSVPGVPFSLDELEKKDHRFMVNFTGFF